MATIKEPRLGAENVSSPTGEGISFTELANRLGTKPAEELFGRIDSDLRHGAMILGKNVREARSMFGRLQQEGRVQVVVPGRSDKRTRTQTDTSEGVVILRFDDLEAVVKAAQDEFSWTRAFAPRSGLPAAISTPELKRGSRGHRTLRA
jgi:hypothetical protein